MWILHLNKLFVKIRCDQFSKSTCSQQFKEAICRIHTTAAYNNIHLLFYSFLGLDSSYSLDEPFAQDLRGLKLIKILARLHSFPNFSFFFQVYLVIGKIQFLSVVGQRFLLSCWLSGMGHSKCIKASISSYQDTVTGYYQYCNLIYYTKYTIPSSYITCINLSLQKYNMVSSQCLMATKKIMKSLELSVYLSSSGEKRERQETELKINHPYLMNLPQISTKMGFRELLFW